MAVLLTILQDALVGLIVMASVFSLLLATRMNDGHAGAPVHSAGTPADAAAMRALLRKADWRTRTRPVASRRFKMFITPSPSNKPRLPEVFDLRNCVCVLRDGRSVGPGRVTLDYGVGDEPATCTCDRECPREVNPRFITEAAGQDVCSLRRQTNYGCTVGCRGPQEKVAWYGFGCGGEGERPCPDLVVTPSLTPSPTRTPPPPIEVPEVTWDPREVVDLRGLQCELLEGREVCFMEDTQGRTLCPDFVTSEYLANPPTSGPHSVDPEIATYCRPDFAKEYYCTAHCQDGNERVQWWTHPFSYCYGKDGYGACPSLHPMAPKAQFTVKPWSAPPEPVTPCQADAAKGVKPEPLKDVSVGLLTHESRAFSLSMATYEKLGLFEVVPEFMVYMNGRNERLEAVAAPYVAKYGPDKIRVMGNSSNVGIAHGIVLLTEAARFNNFLFLERDFQLIEPANCVVEQLRSGVELLNTGAVHVVRYRSRRHAGRPNWAENFFRGHEDDAFVGRQPNLACNIYYWVWDVEKRWPQHFWECGSDPQMLCSDSFFCNWTNNPQLWRIDWWNKEYVEKFDKFQRNDPWYDIEAYMNWEPNAWNERQWIVAQGDGLFKHIDPTKW